MSNINVQQRKFIVKAGMTVDDIKNSKEATVMQKKYASAFDTDGQKGFSQKEADLINATTFAEKSDGTVTFWTRQKDGTKKGTKFDSKDNNIQFKTEDKVKPYVKQVKVKKAAPKQNECVSFFDEAWSGHQIARLTGNNVVTDWLQDKDKYCTDGKDDGKLSAGQYVLSFVKGLVGGIPKTMINHPVATAVTVGLGAGAVALTGGAILPVLGAIGVATGVGMAGYGGYKAVTAKTDGEAKQALETMGMGVTTTALSVAAADKVLEKAAEAGVKSAQLSEDAGILDKTIQMFKAVPESIKRSVNIKGTSSLGNTTACATEAQSEIREIETYDSHWSQKAETVKYIDLPEGSTVETSNGPKVLGKGEMAVVDENGQVSVCKLSTERIGFTKNKEPIYCATINDSRIMNCGSGSLNDATNYVINSQKASDLLKTQALDKTLAEYGVEFIGRQPSKRSTLLEDIIVKINGRIKILQSNWYYTTNESYKQHLISALQAGEDIEMAIK